MPSTDEPQVKRVHPLDAAGLDFSRPASQRVWSKLDNVILRNGTLQTRPGLVPVGPTRQDDISKAAGIPTLLLEASGAHLAKETSGADERVFVRATSTPASSGWAIAGSAPAATIHESLDEDPPDDDVTKVTSSTDGATFTQRFPASGEAYRPVKGITIWTRAKVVLGNDSVTITIKDSNDNTLGSFELTNADYLDDGSDRNAYQDFFTFVPYYYDSDGNQVPFQMSDLTDYDITWGMAINESDNTNSEFIIPASFGNSNDFDEANLTWNDGTPLALFNDSDTYTTGEQGDKVSFTLNAPILTYTSIDSIEIRAGLQHASEFSTARAQFYHEGTDSVDRNVGTTDPLTGGTTRIIQGAYWDGNESNWAPHIGTDIVSSGEIPVNPETSLAWSNAELQAGVAVGLELVQAGGSGSVQLTGFEVIVRGTAQDSGADITAVGMYIHGANRTGTEDPAVDLGRLMTTTTRFQQLEGDADENDTDVGTADSVLDDVHSPATNATGAPYQWDWTEFFDKAFIENGRDDTWSYPNGATNAVNDLTTGILGRSIWTFGNRLMKGDVVEAGVRSSKRVAWCDIADETTWDGTTSGDLDLTHGGAGRIKKGMPLSSHVVAIYLDQGIYNLEWTGDDTIPFVPTIQIEDVGCVAPSSVRSVVDKGGAAVHFFLGEGNNGVSVFAYDGVAAYDIAPEIRDEIQRLSDYNYIENSFSGVDRRNNLYLLAIPEVGQLFPKQCWVYHMNNGHWSKWNFPVAITCMGHWSLVAGDRYADMFSGRAEKTLVVGTENGVPFKFDLSRRVDVKVPGQGEPVNEYSSRQDTQTGSNSGYWDHEVPIEVLIETGDYELAKEGSVRLTQLEKVWLSFVDRGRLDYTVDESIDGGINWINSTTWEFNGEDEGGQNYRMIDFSTPTSARRHRVRIQYSSTSERQHLELVDMSLLYKESEMLP
jgi:hypothetical protein